MSKFTPMLVSFDDKSFKKAQEKAQDKHLLKQKQLIGLRTF
jgi:hypothetical protein